MQFPFSRCVTMLYFCFREQWLFYPHVYASIVMSWIRSDGIYHDVSERQHFLLFLMYMYNDNDIVQIHLMLACVCAKGSCLSLSKIPCHPFLPSGPFQDRFLNPKYPPFVALSSRWPIFQMVDRLACEAGSCPESHVFALGLFRTQSISHLMSYIW